MTAEKRGSIQPIKPQPFSLQTRSCSLQPVKLPTKQNGLSLILLLAVPSRICTQAHSPTHPATLPAQAEVWQLHSTSKCHLNFSIGQLRALQHLLFPTVPALTMHTLVNRQSHSPIPGHGDSSWSPPPQAGGSRTGGTLCQQTGCSLKEVPRPREASRPCS